MKEAFTEGRTQYQWLEKLYAESRKAIPELPPTLEEAYTMGVYKRYFPENHIAYKAFRDDPEANPLPSPSGKIEIYSPRLAELAETWTLLPGQAITALPEYIPNPKARSARNARSGRCSSSGTTTSSARTRPTGTAGGCRKSRRKSSGSTPSTRKPAASNSGIV